MPNLYEVYDLVSFCVIQTQLIWANEWMFLAFFQ